MLQLNRIGRVLDVRWVASSCRTVTAVWRSYEALHSHFANKSVDNSLDSMERSKFLGLSKKLENPVFVKNLGLMLDALQELSDLSLALQRADISLPAGNKLICKQVEVFSARKECDSENYSDACRAVACGEFRGISLTSNSGKQLEIPKGQFYQALADCMKARLLPEVERDLSRAMEALTGVYVHENLSPEYGECEVRFLCTKFGLTFRELKCEYREFKDTQGKVIGPTLRLLLNCVNTIPVSTAECERGFSKMNLICSSLRTKLTVPHMSALMIISPCGPPVDMWQPMKFAKSWLAANRRAADCTQGPQRNVDSRDYNVALKAMWKIL
jgi:uncharacterized protein YfbU (UPF0304 family)